MNIENSYDQAVAEARVLVAGIRTNRLKIAEISLRPHVVKILGHDIAFDPRSANKFAKDIGVSPETLTSWRGAYKKWLEKHPPKPGLPKPEPKPEEFSESLKAFKDRPDSERKRAAPLEERRLKDMLREVEKTRKWFASAPDILIADRKVRSELVVKMREILNVLEDSLK